MKTRFQDGHPAYLRLYILLREEILRGDRQYGEKLPSRRELAREHGLSVITVEHSLDLLTQEGYVEARPKSGYYVIYRETDGFVRAAEQHRPETPETMSRAGTENEGGKTAGGAEDGAWTDVTVNPRPEETFPFSTLARTMRRVLTERGEEILKKTDNPGAPELREAICRYLGRNREIHVHPEQNTCTDWWWNYWDGTGFLPSKPLPMPRSGRFMRRRASGATSCPWGGTESGARRCSGRKPPCCTSLPSGAFPRA